jgi:hypothetical protein
MYKWGKEEYLEILSKKPGLRLALKKVNPGLIDYGRFPYFRRERKYYILYLSITSQAHHNARGIQRYHFKMSRTPTMYLERR